MRSYNFGKGKWVFIDWLGIDPGFGAVKGAGPGEGGACVPQGIELKVHKPRVQPELVLVPDKPWEAKRGIHAYASFLEHEGRFHCWYETDWKDGKIPCENGIGYALSCDGVHWEKPELGVREFAGSTANNLTDLCGHGACVMHDPAAADGYFFKTVMQHNVTPLESKTRWWRQVGGAVSKDGFRWTVLDEPVLPDNHPDTQNILTYDPHRKQYVIYTRQWDGQMQRRGVNRSVSDSFDNFPRSHPVMEVDPNDPPDWDIYCSGYHLWPDCSNAHLMMLSMYRHTSDSCAVYLAVSRDGEIWCRPGSNQALVDLEDVPVDYPVRQVYACHGILRTKPEEWSIYLCPNPAGHNAPNEIRQPTSLVRATLRTDGFISLYSEGRGAFWTIPFELNSAKIHLNVKTGYAGSLRCGILGDAKGETGHGGNEGNFIPGFGIDDCEAVTGDYVDVELCWKGGNLEQLKGQTVRLAFQLYQTDLYAVDFR
ncbi:MAG: hypothetical protein ACYTFY_05530 [Planctomycetota bacterium]|jgi:hypothetical protein